MGSLISSVFRQSQLWGQSRLARLLPSLAVKSSKAGDCTAPLGSLFLDLFPWLFSWWKNVALYLAWTPHLESMGDALLRLPGGFSLDDGERLLLDAPKSSLLWAEQAQLLHQVNPCCTSWMHHSSDWGIIVLFCFFFGPVYFGCTCSHYMARPRNLPGMTPELGSGVKTVALRQVAGLLLLLSFLRQCSVCPL